MRETAQTKRMRGCVSYDKYATLACTSVAHLPKSLAANAYWIPLLYFLRVAAQKGCGCHLCEKLPWCVSKKRKSNEVRGVVHHPSCVMWHAVRTNTRDCSEILAGGADIVAPW